MKMNVVRAALIALSVLVGACSSLAPQDSQLISGDLSQLQREGRFAVLVYDKTIDKNIDSVQGNFSWLSQGSQITLDLSTPLGQTLARVEANKHYAKLTHANGEVVESNSPDTLVQRVLGRQFPVSHLLYWIRGIAIPNQDMRDVQYDAQNRLSKLTQAAWSVSFQDYDAKGPKRFVLINNQTTERITIRISMN